MATTRAAQVRTTQFELRGGTGNGADGRRGEPILVGPVDEEFVYWFTSLKRQPGASEAEPIWAYREETLVWASNPDASDGPVASMRAPGEIDSLDHALAERRTEVDRLEARAASLTQQCSVAETQLRYLQEDISSKQLDIHQARERARVELEGLEAMLRTRRELDAIERARLAKELEAQTTSSTSQTRELSELVTAQIRSTKEQIAEIATFAKELNTMSQAEAGMAASQKLAAATSTQTAVQTYRNMEELLLEHMANPHGAQNPKAEFWRIAGDYVKGGGLNGLIEGIFGAFGKPFRRPGPATDEDDE